MRKFWPLLLVVLFSGCGGYNPARGELELKIEREMNLPPGKLSVAISPRGEVFVAGKGKGIVKIKPSGGEEEVLKPGVFTYSPDLFYTAGCLWATASREVVKICPGEVPRKGILDRFYQRVVPTREGRLVGDYLEIGREKAVRKLVLIADGKEPERLLIVSASLGTLVIKSPRGVSAVSAPEVLPSLLWAYSPYTDHLITAESQKYGIRILNLEGKILRSFAFKVEAPELPLSERLKIAPTFLIWKPRDRQRALEEIARKLPSRLPVLAGIYPLPSGYFLVEVNEAPGRTHFDLLSEKGEYLYRFNLPRGYKLRKVLSNGWLAVERKGKLALYRPLHLLSFFRKPS